MIRGLKQQCELFRMFMQTQMFAWKRKNLKTKKWEVTMTQGALRECGFVYEYVFPEECLDEVLTMLDVRNGDTMGVVRAAVIRKALGKGVMPVPEYKDVPNKWVKVEGLYLTTGRYIERHGVAIYPIGIKKDVKKEYPDYGYEQEGL